MDDLKKQAQATKDEIKSYKKLEKINKSQEFNDFFDMQVVEAARKMIAAFSGEGPKDWEEFCRVRGEVIGILYPIQQVRGAKFVVKQLEGKLNEWYNKEPI